MDVLVVDDEATSAACWAACSKPRDTGARVAESGERALAALEESSFDVVLLDLNMPGMSGLDALAQIRERAPETGGDHGLGRGAAPPTRSRPGGAAPSTSSRSRWSRRRSSICWMRSTSASRVTRGRRAAPGADAELRHDRRQPGDAQAARTVRRVAPSQGTRAHHRRERLRQGTGGARDPPALDARGRAVRQAQLRRDPARPGRERAVRPRARRVHRRGAEPQGADRAGRPGHAVPGRDRRPVARGAGQAAARARDRRGRARGRHRTTPVDVRFIAATNKDLRAGDRGRRRSARISSTG